MYWLKGLELDPIDRIITDITLSSIENLDMDICLDIQVRRVIKRSRAEQSKTKIIQLPMNQGWETQKKVYLKFINGYLRLRNRPHILENQIK